MYRTVFALQREWALPAAAAMALLAVCTTLAPAAPALAIGPDDSGLLIYSTEGNRLRRYDFDTIGSELVEDILIERASGGGANDRDVNGVICAIPDGSGRFVLGEDSGQPDIPAGWGVFSANGVQEGKLTATYQTDNAEPFGCVFDGQARLFTTDVGSQAIGSSNGQLILWFPPYDVFPGAPTAFPNDSVSDNFCKIAVDIGTAGQPVIDDEGRIYVSSSGGLSVLRFSPPFPAGPDAAGGCGGTDPQGSPLADAVNREVFLGPDGLSTYSGIALAPNGNLYIATNLTGTVAEYTTDGDLVRYILDPGEFAGLPIATGNPQSLAVAPDGTVFYADLDLQGALPSVGPGPNGKVRRISFDSEGKPNPPEIVRQNLSFPDGVAIVGGNLEPLTEWRTYAGSYDRLFYNPHEAVLTRDNVHLLDQAWTFPTDGAITASPVVAAVDIPGEGPTQVVYFQSWDLSIYALRIRDGSLLWQVETAEQPGASFPSTGTADVSRIDGRDIVFIGAGQIMYALDAITGEEIWRFTAGTGCEDEFGNPPGLCGFDGERNQIESSAAVVGGRVFFGMDINDVPTGKGGFFGLDARTGSMDWYFDLDTGATCRPNPDDDIRRFDGYHSEQELGLPSGFFATRSGCDFDRRVTGCGNVWSSPAVDEARGLMFFGSSNCDTDDDPNSAIPPPPMPPYEEAIIALDLDGNPAWRWRPREVDNDDLAFGAVPNLFSIFVNGAHREVVGVGGKDGTYYVIDREGHNAVNGVAWDDADPSDLPYWRTRVIAGGDIGGIIATAAADVDRRRIFISTAPGTNAANGPPGAPQRPTFRALDMDTGAVVWDNSDEPNAFASFGPTSAIPGVAFSGQVPFAVLRAYDTANDAGKLLGTFNVQNAALASGPVVVDGLLLVGGGIGTRTQTGSGPSDIAADTPSPLTALCVPGTPLCNICGNGIVDPAEQCDDGNALDGDGCSTTCEFESVQVFSGVAEGGVVSFVVNGVYLEVPTVTGFSAFDVAAAGAAAINANPLLAASGVRAQVEGRGFFTNAVLTGAKSTDPGLAVGEQPIACPAEAPVFVEAGIISDSAIFDVELRLGGEQIAYVSMRGVTAGANVVELDAHDPADNSAHFGFCSPATGLLELYVDGTFRGEAKVRGGPGARVLSYSPNQTNIAFRGRDIIQWGVPLLPREGIDFTSSGFFQLLDQLTDDYSVHLPGTFELLGGGLTTPDDKRTCTRIGGADSALFPVPADVVRYREAVTGIEVAIVAGHPDQEAEEVNTYCTYKSRREVAEPGPGSPSSRSR